MTSTAYRPSQAGLIPECPEFTKEQVQAWWTHNPSTHIALGYCPEHKRRVQPSREDHEFGRQPSCSICGSWLTTLEVVALGGVR